MAPWHMWGTSETLVIPGPNPGQPSQQLARIDYDRPQTWSFLLFAQLPQAIATPNMDVRFDALIGLGRTTAYIPLATLRVNSTGELAWTTAAPSTGVLDPITGNVTTQLVESFPAQTIQCNATILNSPPTGSTVLVGAFFSPFAHSRAEWFNAVGR